MSRIFGALTAALAIAVPWVAWSSFQGLILGNCDPKFGCVGGVQFVSFFSGVAGLISAIAFLLATSLPKLANREVTKAHQIGAGAVGGIMLAFFLATVPNWYFETGGMVVGWFFLSLVLFTVILLLLKSMRNEGT